jgi:hypothetical protein
MESVGNLQSHAGVEWCISTRLYAHEEAPADRGARVMAQQTQPNQQQQSNKPGQPNQMPNKPGQTQQSSSDQHDQSANKK